MTVCVRPPDGEAGRHFRSDDSDRVSRHELTASPGPSWFVVGFGLVAELAESVE